HCLSYIGMQFVEPFGMGVAESMAASAPVVISREAGITKWVLDRREAIVVDPEDPLGAARKLIGTMKEEGALERIASGGRKLALETFRWKAIGAHQGEIMDSLCRDAKKVTERAYHRTAFTWRGDPPEVEERHGKAARGLLSHIVERAQQARRAKKRAVVVLGGESGVGKTEIAEYLRYLLRSEKMRGVTIAGDAFFRLAPEANHRARLEAYEQGRLEQYVGSGEVDLERLDEVLKDATDRNIDEVFVPSDCRRLDSRRYPSVPVSLAGADVVLVDLTYGLVLKNVTLKIFLESDYQGRIATVKKRNLARDPDQDFAFIQKVLEIEHRIIQEMKERADIVVTGDYEARPK
ncbi:MAG: hypothetical protein JRD89_13135, partial [Deltaproteobacteria bacterium]|nr:hypothetical protein [Deltaproteobacteria bacterium]